MKLAEALLERSELQTRLSLLNKRLVANARIQEGEHPAEEPDALFQELDELLERLEKLCVRINLTNSCRCRMAGR